MHACALPRTTISGNVLAIHDSEKGQSHFDREHMSVPLPTHDRPTQANRHSTFHSIAKNGVPASFTSCAPPEIRWFQSLPTSASSRGVCSDATRRSASTIAMLVLHKHDHNYDIITRKKQLEQVALNMRTNPAMKKPKKKMANTCTSSLL